MTSIRITTFEHIIIVKLSMGKALDIAQNQYTHFTHVNVYTSWEICVLQANNI